jgi:hypothetical protein
LRGNARSLRVRARGCTILGGGTAGEDGRQEQANSERAQAGALHQELQGGTGTKPAGL